MGLRPRTAWAKASSFRNACRLLSSVSLPPTIDNVGASISRMSTFWIPTSTIAPVKKDDNDIHARLVRYGFLRQAHSGIFHLLPLGHRVQRKLERLVDHYMESLGASRLDLSTLSAESLWEMSGRLDKVAHELFRLADRKGSPYLLAPTHEEEITTLVAKSLHSYRELPLRLYQITRKYRDEMRPRAGMLRAREFAMKDLYTFDYSPVSAMDSYQAVRNAYAALFSRLNLPVVAAEASSGDMGGSLSHEYLLPTQTGEDELVSCSSCGYTANAQVTGSFLVEKQTTDATAAIAAPTAPAAAILENSCPQCHNGTVTVQKAMELGHTFYLGTRYSKPLGARVTVPAALLGQGTSRTVSVPLEMGCYGIGISRLMAAAAQHCSPPGRPGISWPSAIAPFQVAVLYPPELDSDATEVAFVISAQCAVDILLDDRPETLPWKMRDADDLGYPLLVIVGKHWRKAREVEVQCSKLDVKRVYDIDDVSEVVKDLLERL